MKMKRTTPTMSLAALALLASRVLAQNAAAPAPASAKDEDPLQLSPFSVVAGEDKGHQAHPPGNGSNTASRP